MPPQFPEPGANELLTVRDWLRFAVSNFNQAQLTYGHGTTSALDEAAFLILSTLHLPVDELEPWLDCRLTNAEQEKVASIIRARAETRKPAPYLTQSAWIGGHKFYVDERVIVPRSFIGELICKTGLSTAIGPEQTVARILDLCTGSGCLAILASLAFPDAAIDASDISPDALAVARRNVADYDLKDRITLYAADLFDNLPPARYDLIIANPPYVTAAAVKAFPPEYRAEPELAHLGGRNGLDLVKRILDHAVDFLTAEGTLVVEIGDGRDVLESARPDLPFLWLDTETSEGEVFMLTAGDLTPLKPAKSPRTKANPA